MAFTNSMSKVTRASKMARAGGKVAASMARQNKDPLILQRDKLKEKLKMLNEKIKQKYASRARTQMLMKRN